MDFKDISIAWEPRLGLRDAIRGLQRTFTYYDRSNNGLFNVQALFQDFAQFTEFADDPDDPDADDY